MAAIIFWARERWSVLSASVRLSKPGYDWKKEALAVSPSPSRKYWRPGPSHSN